jgi:hypothetical protein
VIRWHKIPKAQDPAKQFVGRTITAYPTAKDAWFRSNGARLEVEHIAGNLTHQTMFQINGSHLVSMLDAYCELNGNPLPNMEMHEGFLSTVATQVRQEISPQAIDARKRPVLDG